MQCYLCSNTKFSIRFRTEKYEILQCLMCGVYVKKPAKQPQKPLYNNDYYSRYPYSHSLGLTKRYFLEKVRILQKLIGKSAPSVLDVGCGWGDFGKVATGEGLPYFGIDDSPIAIKKCKLKNLDAEKKTINELISEKKRFDVIVSFQTIEHVKNPLLMIKSIHALLKKGGIILLTTPNNDSPLRKIFGGEWSVYNTDSHYVFYDAKTLKLLLENAGFNDIKIRLDPPRFFTPSYIFSRMYQKKSILNPLFSVFSLPIPTDPWGDLEAIAHI